MDGLYTVMPHFPSHHLTCNERSGKLISNLGFQFSVSGICYLSHLLLLIEDFIVVGTYVVCDFTMISLFWTLIYNYPLVWYKLYCDSQKRMLWFTSFILHNCSIALHQEGFKQVLVFIVCSAYEPFGYT